MLPHAEFPLNERYSYLFIRDGNSVVHRRLPNARSQVRLNLGRHFAKYFNNQEFRTHVDLAVDNPRKQIWSDLREFFVPSGEIGELSLLAALPNLQQLDFGRTNLVDISPLRTLVNLQSLSLKDATRLADITPLAELTELRELYLSGTQVQLLDPLTQLVHLERLTLPDTVAGITSLHGLVNLEVLELGASQAIVDISPLAALTNLRALVLRGTMVSNLRPLAELAHLETLELDHTAVTDIGALVGLHELTSLTLRGTAVADITAVAALRQLRWLDLCDTQVHDLSPLAELQQLRWLELTNTPVINLSPLAGLAQLQELYIQDNHVIDVRPLAGLGNLRIFQ